MFGLKDAKNVQVIVSCMNETVVSTRSVTCEDGSALFEEIFSWSVSLKDVGRFSSLGIVCFEIFNAQESEPLLITTVEVSVKMLLEEGNVERVEPLRLQDECGVALDLRIGVFSEKGLFHSLNRFKQHWKLRRVEISFWTRLFSSCLAGVCLFVGAQLVDSDLYLGLTDVVVGSIMGSIMWSHAMSWAGIHILEILKFDVLGVPAIFSFLSFTIMLALWLVLARASDSKWVCAHIVTTGMTGLTFLLFLLAEVRKEPGSGWLRNLFKRSKQYSLD